MPVRHPTPCLNAGFRFSGGFWTSFVVPKTVQWETGTWRKPSSSGLSCLDSPFPFEVPGSVTSSLCLSVPIWEVGSVLVGL